MSTCSTANSAHSRSHVLAGPRPRCNQDAVGQRCAACLKRRLSDLERHWDECKTRLEVAARPRHRRSRSDTTPSSAVVTGAGPETPGLFPVLLCSPRKLLSSLQQTASSSGCASASAGVVTAVEGGIGKRSRARRYEEDIQDASSICSVDAAVAMAAAASSCPCSCECTIPRCPCGYSCSCGYGYGYSSISSCSGSTAATSLFSLREGTTTTVAGKMRKRREGGGWTACGVGRFAAIAFIGVAVWGAVAVMEFGMDDSHMEFLVPT